MDLKKEYDDFFQGLDSRFHPKLVSIEEQTNGTLKLLVEETFQNHSIESTFLYKIFNDGSILPVLYEIDYESDESIDSFFSLNSFDTSDHREDPEIHCIISQKDLDARKWTYMIPLEEFMFAKRSIAFPIIESL